MASGSAKQLLLFNISGGIGTALFYYVYETILEACSRGDLVVSLQDEAACATPSWVAAYSLSIIWQHALHRYLVFGPKGSYVKTLLWTYVSYALSIVLSTVLHKTIVDFLGASPTLAFGLTLAATGLFNYFTLSSAFSDGDDAKSSTAGKVDKKKR